MKEKHINHIETEYGINGIETTTKPNFVAYGGSAKETLLEKAKTHPNGRKASLFQNITDEHIELAMAWVKDEISPSQAAVGLGLKLTDGNYQRHFARFLREAYRRGKLKEIK